MSRYLCFTAIFLLFAADDDSRRARADEFPPPRALAGVPAGAGTASVSEGHDENHRRLRLIADARRAFLDGEVEAAVDLTQQALELDRKLFSDADLRVAWRLRTLANYHLELEQLDEALRLARESADLIRSTHDAESWQVEDADRFIEVTDAIATLPRSKRQRFLHAARQLESADERHEAKLALAAAQYRAGVLMEIFGDRHLSVVSELITIEDRLIQAHDADASQGQLHRLERLIPQISKTPNPEFGRLYLARALLSELQDDNAAAERHYQQAIEVFTASNVPFDENVPTAHNNYAVLLDDLQRHAEAEPHYKVAGEVWAQELDDTCWIYYRIQSNRVLLEQKAAIGAVEGRDWDEAEQRVRTALRIIRTTWGEADYRIPEFLTDVEWVAQLRQMNDEQLADYERAGELQVASDEAAEAGDYDRAIKLAGERRDLTLKLLGEASLETARAEYSLAWLQPDSPELEARYEKLAEVFRTHLGPLHPEYAHILKELVRMDTRYDATTFRRGAQAIEAYAHADGTDSWQYASMLALHGTNLQRAGKLEAEKVLLEAKTRLQNLGETDSVEYFELLSDLGSIYNAKSQPMAALPLLRESIALGRTFDDYDPAVFSTTINELANTYYSIAQYDRALEHYVEAIELERDAPTRVECNYRMSLRNTGELFYTKGDYDASIRYFRELFDHCHTQSFECYSSCLDGMISLASLYRNQEHFVKSALVLDHLEGKLAGGGEMPADYAAELRARIELQRMAIARDRGSWNIAQEKLRQLWTRIKPPAGAQSPEQSVRSADSSLSDDQWASLLVELYEMADGVKDATIGIEIRATYADFAEVYHAETPWLIAEAKCELQEAQQRAALTDAQHETLKQADILWEEGVEASAVSKMLEAVELRISVLGSTHRDVATELLDLAWQELERGKVEQAYGRYLDAVEIRRELLTDDHAETAYAKRYAAIAARKAVEFEASQRLLNEALAAEQRVYGADHVELAETYHSQAILYISMGHYATALSAALEASQRFELRDGEKSRNYASSLRTLYGAYDALGESEKATNALTRSHNILKEITEPDDIDFLDSLYAGAVEASIYPSSQALSETLFKQLCEGLRAAGLEETERYALALSGQGKLYQFLEDYEQAKAVLTRALVLRQSIYDQPDHPLIADLHSMIGSAALEGGDLDAADKHLSTAYELRKKRLGERSHNLLIGLSQLARVKALQQDANAALSHLTTCFEIEQKLLDDNSLIGSEHAVADVLDDGGDKFALLLSLHASEQSPGSVESALSWTLGRKGLALDIACRLQAAKRLLMHQPETAKSLAEIQSLRRELTESALSAESDAAERTKMTQRVAELQRQLAFKIRDSGVETTRTRVDVDQIRSRLPESSALLELVVTKLANLESREGKWTPEHVLAFFVPSDPDATCRLVDLGPASEINALVEDLRSHIQSVPRSLRMMTEADLEQQLDPLAKALYERLLGPFEEELASLDFLLVAPDGELHRAPLAALRSPSDRYLIEDVAITYLSSGRDLLRDHSPAGKGSLILADPDYDASRQERLATASELNSISPAVTAIATRGAAPELRSLRWRSLPGARQEAKDVERHLETSDYQPVQSYVGAAAVEEVLKEAISPRLVHVATHGFYVPHDESDPLNELAPSSSSGGTGLGRLRRDVNPLLRSGIVLAGANKLQYDDQAEALDDGWVTAQEIASMDFRNTELVVLSACESGLGEEQIGHGVHGLRRALLIAGAHNLLTSLFEVPDEETRELMNAFYESLVVSSHPAEALHEAQQAIIQQRRAKHKAAHPFYWASFFVLGRPEVEASPP
ncbi:CHAT domain-containing protein [Pirellulales bacterium]|nr:CHAT domain-containing protein [Pirellulales bacterium]